MAIGNYDPKKGTLLRNHESTLANNSGDGPNSPVLDIVAKKFNWGAFCLSWIWGLWNNTHITLIMLLTYFLPWVGTIVSIGLAIWFGIKGNTWAWQNKRWESIEQFHSVQKKWAIAGAICAFIGTVITICAIVLFLFAMQFAMKEEVKIAKKETIKKDISVLIAKSSKFNSTFTTKCDGTSEGLASYFAQGLNGSTFKGNEVRAIHTTPLVSV